MSDKPRISRHERRIAAFRLIFAREFNKDTDVNEFYDSFTVKEEGEVVVPGDGDCIVPREFRNEYVKDMLIGVESHAEEIDELIADAAIKWKITRMSLATKSVLRLAVYEMKYTDTPPKVVINEAVEIIKSYDEDSAPSFVNGILNRIGRALGLIAEPQAVGKPEHVTE